MITTTTSSSSSVKPRIRLCRLTTVPFFPRPYLTTEGRSGSDPDPLCLYSGFVLLTCCLLLSMVVAVIVVTSAPAAAGAYLPADLAARREVGMHVRIGGAGADRGDYLGQLAGRDLLRRLGGDHVARAERSGHRH